MITLSQNRASLVGQRFTRLFVYDTKVGAHGRTLQLCRCDCGKETSYTAAQLIDQIVVSCGCYRKLSKRKAPGESGLQQLLCRYRRTARICNRAFELDKETFVNLTSSKCHYCGESPQKEALASGRGFTEEGLARSAYTYNGIDRIDNSLGYVFGNVVPCCTRCNLIKRNMSKTEFLGHVTRIYQHSVFNAKLR